jgi:hypothetical protein
MATVAFGTTAPELSVTVSRTVRNAPEESLRNAPNRAQKRSGRPFLETKMNYEMTLEGAVSCFPEASPEDGRVSGVTTRCCT